MVKGTIDDLLLEYKLIRMLRGKSSITSVVGIISKVSVGRKTKIKVLAIVEVHILRINVVIMIRLLVCQNLVANPQQQAQDNMRGARPQGKGINDLRPPNLYYDQGNARQNFHPPNELQTTNEYINVQRVQVAQPPKDPDPYNSQDVRFVDSSTIPLASEVLPTHVAPTNGQGQWPP